VNDSVKLVKLFQSLEQPAAQGVQARIERLQCRELQKIDAVERGARLGGVPVGYLPATLAVSSGGPGLTNPSRTTVAALVAVMAMLAAGCTSSSSVGRTGK
jgi:hypothetical protein